jgi:hypothetical protein
MWRPRADHGQKQDAGARTTHKEVDQRPVTRLSTYIKRVVALPTLLKSCRPRDNVYTTYPVWLSASGQASDPKQDRFC